MLTRRRSPANTTFSLAGQDSNAMFNDNAMSLFVSKATNRDEERHGVVVEHRIGVLTCERKGGVCRTPSPREHTRAWRGGTHLQPTLSEASCAIGISGGVKAAPLGIRHGQRSEERRVGKECRSGWSP